MPGGQPSPQYTLRGSHGPVTSLLFLAHSPHLVVGTQNGNICIWDLETKRLQHHITGHAGDSILWLHQLSNDVIISQGRDGWLLWWRLQNGAWDKVDSYEYGAKGFCCCAALPPNDTIAVVIAVPTEESVVKIVSFATKEHITSLIPEKGARTYGMCMSMRACVLAEQAHVLVGYEDGSVGLWEAGNGTELSHLQLHTQPLMCMDYHAELCRGFSGSTDEHIKMWTVTEDKKLLQKMEINMTNPGVNAACFRGDGKLWVVGGSDSCGHMFSKSGRKLAVLSGHRDSVQALTFNDEGVLAVGSKDEAVSLWKLY